MSRSTVKNIGSWLHCLLAKSEFPRQEKQIYLKKKSIHMLIAKFCVNIAFSGAIRILAASLRHHMQNDWTSIQEVTAHWRLPCHSTLDRFANSVWSQPWLRTPPRHYKSSQWRAESGRWNKHASCCYFGLYGDNPPPTLIYACYSW